MSFPSLPSLKHSGIDAEESDDVPMVVMEEPPEEPAVVSAEIWEALHSLPLDGITVPGLGSATQKEVPREAEGEAGPAGTEDRPDVSEMDSAAMIRYLAVEQRRRTVSIPSCTEQAMGVCSRRGSVLLAQREMHAFITC